MKQLHTRNRHEDWLECAKKRSTIIKTHSQYRSFNIYTKLVRKSYFDEKFQLAVVV